MPTECCVPQCKGGGGSHLAAFEPCSRVRDWLAAVKREERWRPTKHSVVCKIHFEEDDYESQTTSGKFSVFTYVNIYIFRSYI